MKTFLRNTTMIALAFFMLSWSSRYIEHIVEQDPTTSGLGLPAFMRLSPQWALEQLEGMTLEEKIAQSFMIAVTPKLGSKDFQRVDSLVRTYKLGGIIMFQGKYEESKSMIDSLQAVSQVPLLVGLDAEWGSVMRISDGKQFPYQLTLGAANQPENTRVIAQAMGAELNDLGVNISFSPVVDINTNPNNPIIGFRSFGENPVRVSEQSSEMIKGLQDFNVLATMKHFPGHGDTDVDSHKDLPVVNKSLIDLQRSEWVPYKQGRLVGASAIMIGHLDVPALDASGTPSSLSSVVLHDYVRGELKFEGLIISDALNMKAVTKKYGEVDVAKKAYLAGNDILLYSSKVKESIAAIKNAVEKREITEEEINDKTLRILRAKYYAAVYNNDKKPTLNQEVVDYTLLDTYEKALTVIRNENAIPVKDASGKNLILNLGGNGDDFVQTAFNYILADTATFKSAIEAQTSIGTSLGEYKHIFINLIAKSNWNFRDYSFPEGWREFLESLPKNGNVYVSVFGNPYALQKQFIFSKTKAVVLAYQNSKQGQNRAAQLLFGGLSATGKLPITINVDYQMGYGIETAQASRLKFTVPMELGLSDSVFYKIDSIVMDGIEQRAFPSVQIVIAKGGKVIYRKAFGHFTYEDDEPVDNRTLYDVASITKIAATAPSLMYLQDQNSFSLDSTLKAYLPDLTKGSVYGSLNTRDMLTHQARLTPWIPFYKSTLNGSQPKPELYSKTIKGDFSAPVAKDLFIDKNYEDSMLRIILTKPLRSTKSYKYSDIGYYFFKQIIENKTDQALDDFTLNHFYAPMGLSTMGYNPLTRFPLNRIAPTEKDNYYRHQLVQGYVHDMGAAMEGGVGGHAGIFATATDLAGLMQMYLNGGFYGGHQYLSKEVVEEYTRCQFCPTNRRGAAFDRPIGSGSGGPSSNLVSQQSYGHSGFTGTLVWADPKYEITYVFLSNRVYPSADNWKITRMNIRTNIQDEIYRILTNDKLKK